MKTCIRCGDIKPFSDFYRHPQMAGGHLGKCKACQKADVTANRNANLNRYRAYDRKRGSRMKPGYLRRHRQDHPGRVAAHSAVARAIQSGALVVPEACWHCGSADCVVGHHPDYSNHLGVSWMCQACHRQLHRDAAKLLSASP